MARTGTTILANPAVEERGTISTEFGLAVHGDEVNRNVGVDPGGHLAHVTHPREAESFVPPWGIRRLGFLFLGSETNHVLILLQNKIDRLVPL